MHIVHFHQWSAQFSSVTQLQPTLCDPMNCSPASLSITNSWSLLKLMSIELVMPSYHFILCRPLFLPPSIFPSISGFLNESVPCIRWLKYWGFSFGIRAFRMDWLDLLAVQGLSRVFSNTTIQKHQFFSSQLSLWSNSHIHT